ncbi:MAG TPA: efflux RND transporter permease subunit [Chloroflexota bacterium]|nr:efflux RND transporter permease subunit [Chloroflexota bacterium]
MSLTRLAVVRPLTVLMGLLGLVIMGGVAYSFLKIDRLPPISVPFVSVAVSYTGATAQDVEQLLTIPVENAVSGMPGVSSVTSSSNEGSANVSVQLVDGTDPTQAALEVERRVNAIRARLPADAGEPRVNKADPNAQPIMEVALTGGKPDQLFQVANDQFIPTLQSVPGVGSVNLSGGLQSEIQVKVDYAKLAAYGLTLSQITTALTSANVDAPVGAIQQNTQTLDVRSLGAFQTLDDLSNLVISQTTNGGPILLHDLAAINRGYKTQTQLLRLNGQDAVGLQIVKQSDANALQVGDDVRVALRKLQNLLPSSSQIVVTNDTSIFTRASLDAIQHDLLLSVLLVGAVMLLFLHAWRHTVIVLLAIPTSLISTFLIMYALGFSLNIMSLMALALMIGILVDDSIVVLENIHRHLQLGESPFQAALTGRSEIGMAAIAITMADVVVYTPLAFISGILGQLFRQYGLTIVAATLFSLLISFTLTPMLASRWLGHDDKANQTSPLARFGVWWDGKFDALGRGVAHMVPSAVKFRWLILLLCIGLVGATVSLVPLGLIGSEYAPQEDSNQFSVNINTPPGTALPVIDDNAKQMEAILLKMPEVQYVFTSVSGGGGGFGRGGGRASLDVQVVPKAQRDKSVFQMIDEIRTIGRRMPGVTVNADAPSPLGGGGGFGGGGTASVNVQLAGPDLPTLNQISDQVITTMSTIPGLADVRNSSNSGNPELHIQLDRTRMAQLNVTSQAVATALRTAVSGSVVTPFRPAGQTQLDITLIASDTDRLNLANLSAIPVGTGQAGNAAATSTTSTTPTIVTLGQIATIGYGTGPTQIQRVDRNRTTTITGTATGRPIGDVAKDVTTAMKQIELPAGYSYQLRGGVQQLNNAFATLGQALVLSILLEYMLLVALYESWFYPIVLILGVPLGIVGALLGLWVTHNTLNIFSIIGLIMAVGLVAKTGILLVDFTNTLRKRGMGRTEALAESARVRLRPILMTTATMTFGMVPLALKLEPGAESRAPMAVVVIGGLLSSTLLAIFVTPSLYTLLDDVQNLVFRPGRGKPAVGEHVALPANRPLPAPVAVPVAAGATTAAVHDTNGHGPTNGANGHGGSNGANGSNGHHVEPTWLQRLKAGRFEDD